MNKIVWKPKALKQARKIEKNDRFTIFKKVLDLAHFPNVQNVKALKNYKYQYRLRVGNYRVMFDFQNEIKIISIEEVKKRDENTY